MIALLPIPLGATPPATTGCAVMFHSSMVMPTPWTQQVCLDVKRQLCIFENPCYALRVWVWDISGSVHMIFRSLGNPWINSYSSIDNYPSCIIVNHGSYNCLFNCLLLYCL